MKQITKIAEYEVQGRELCLEIQNRHGSRWFLVRFSALYCIRCGHKGLWMSTSDTEAGDLLECAKCRYSFWFSEQSRLEHTHPSIVALRAAEDYATTPFRQK
jgi:hypothetical protein